MPPILRQSSGHSTGNGVRTCKVTLVDPTITGNLVVVVATATNPGTEGTTLTGPAGFTLIRVQQRDELTVGVWYRENCPPISTVEVSSSAARSLIVRVLEYSGAAQSGALDKVTVQSSRDGYPRTGSSGTTAQADSIVVAAVGNRYASTTQGGFIGALTRLYESTSPSDSDDRRCRMTVHQAITALAGSYALSAFLSAARDWIAVLCVFKGGSLGPARLTSTTAPSMLEVGGTGSLTVFGALTSVSSPAITPYLDTDVPGASARIGPCDYQYRLGGWKGLLIGADTPYYVESHDGLEGWEIRTSDDELPRGDGSLRGVDLQAARQIMFSLKVGGSQAEVEDAMDALYRALVPQRDSDWELIWRHPGRPLRMVRCRPVNIGRELSWRETLINHQKFALLAADPRHYSASPRQIKVPNTPAGATTPTPVSTLNEGSGQAYPTIRISGTQQVNRVELVNHTQDIAFLVQAVLPAGSTLLGDMEARATGAPRSVVSIDGQAKYGAWQHPRTTFSLGPGENLLHLVTDPPGAAVTATLDYRDTWSG